MSVARLETAAEPREVVEGSPYRMTAEEFFRAVDADVFTPDRRVWLWRGRLYEAMARKLPHAVGFSKLVVAVAGVCPAGWSLWSDSPILVDDFSAPLPDLAVVRGTPDDYARRGTVPRAPEIGLLVVEVSDSTLRRDLTGRLRVFAAAGLPVYWVINLVSRRVEVFSRPVSEGDASRYEVSETFGRGESVPIVLDGQEAARIPVNDLLPEESA